ncbi:HD domain-containing protein [uncultured Leifsonia sp.]|uniref:HD domain-containing protein n=1 Tax=uncultured Leifsonia sp. TaxID=340359 RepID=UPI0025FE44BD|nr:HD domain-containing protein [uncultured Leifsonia sp.]
MNTDLVDRARTLARERLAVAMPQRWAHVVGVAKTASDIAPRLLEKDADAIVAAAWLHDVGYAPSIAMTGFHPVDGARFAKCAGMPALVVSLIAHHSGASAEAIERGLDAELAEFDRPPRDVLDVVTYADMTTAPDGTPIEADRRVSEILSRYSRDDPVHAAVSRSSDELLAAVARIKDQLRLAPAGASQPR